jgi:hypothetical protein
LPLHVPTFQELFICLVHSQGTLCCAGTETLKVFVRILPLIVFKLYLSDLNIHSVKCI